MRSNPNCNGKRRAKWHWGLLRTACIKNVTIKIIKIRTSCQYRILSLQLKLKLGCTKPSTGPHAARGPRVGHRGFKQTRCTILTDVRNPTEPNFADYIPPYVAGNWPKGCEDVQVSDMQHFLGDKKSNISMGVGRVFAEWGAIVDFFRWWPNRFFQVVSTVVKLHSLIPKPRKNNFYTETLIVNYQISKSKGCHDSSDAHEYFITCTTVWILRK